ncbi:MAG: Hsp20/alpha crystallin family protein [Acidimicrobiia bacterium]|nr:Hsp20/alpha crystallin family protein [Acidimicrobiia bacterium]
MPRFFNEGGFRFRPSLDVVRTDGELVITAELPGIDAENVELSLDAGVLTIAGEKMEDKEVAEEDRYIHERSYGKFQRRIPMPDGVNADKMEADFDAGVLTVHITLPEEKSMKPQTIPIAVS